MSRRGAVVARQAHNLEVTGSNPVAATQTRGWYQYHPRVFSLTPQVGVAPDCQNGRPARKKPRVQIAWRMADILQRQAQELYQSRLAPREYVRHLGGHTHALADLVSIWINWVQSWTIGSA